MFLGGKWEHQSLCGSEIGFSRTILATGVNRLAMFCVYVTFLSQYTNTLYTFSHISKYRTSRLSQRTIWWGSNEVAT